MLMRILLSPMAFFDTTPLGRILNRFSKDIDIIDSTIPMNVRMLFNQILSVIGTVVAVVFAMPIFIVVVIPVTVLYYFVQKEFLITHITNNYISQKAQFHVLSFTELCHERQSIIRGCVPDFM